MAKPATVPEWASLEHSLIHRQAALVRSLQSLAMRSETLVYRTILPLLHSIQESLDTLLMLFLKKRFRDSLAISRMIFELCVNACFILAGGDEAANKARRHLQQRSVRDLNMNWQLADDWKISVRFSAAEEIRSLPDNQEALQEFTSRKGRELAWTSETVSERIMTIGNRFGRDMTQGLLYSFTLYKHASEIVHGTVFGVMYSLGSTSPDERKVSIASFQRKELKFLMLRVGCSIHALIGIIGSGLKEGSRLATKSRRLIARYWGEDRRNESTP